MEQAEPPRLPVPEPNPPTAEEAGRIINESFRDPEWGALVWLAMVTGARRGEICALKWRKLNLETGALHINGSIGQRGKRHWEKSTKTHQHRRIALDPETILIFRELRQRLESQVEVLGLSLSKEAYIFSRDPDGTRYMLPDTVSQRYDRLLDRLDIDSTIKNLRHYSATELISAGVDVRTVAGRLGHSGGGSTTLKVYSAWVSESDQRASIALASRVPPRPIYSDEEVVRIERDAPYQKIAEVFKKKIESREFTSGEELPTLKQIAQIYGVSVGTAHRSLALLAREGLVITARSKRTKVA